MNYFLGIKTIENDLKITAQCWAEIGPQLQRVACHARSVARWRARRRPGDG
jgi:hypothetical protein